MNGGRTYKKLYMTFVEPHDSVENCEWPLAWLRETDKRVYAILNPNNPFVQTDQMMTLSGPRTPTEDYDSTGEWLLFDFNNIHVNYNSTLKNSMTMERSDSDFVFDGYKRVTYKPKYGNNKFYIVEGYGALNGKHFIFPVHNYFGYPNPYGDYSIGMTHVTNDNGDILYKTFKYDFYLTSVSDVSATPKAKIKVTQGLITAESADDGTLYLYNISGTLAGKQSGNGNATCSIGTDGLASGVYVAVWRGTSGTVSQKVVVQ